jgi:hypothetical protein
VGVPDRKQRQFFRCHVGLVADAEKLVADAEK